MWLPFGKYFLFNVNIHKAPAPILSELLRLPDRYRPGSGRCEEALRLAWVPWERLCRLKQRYLGWTYTSYRTQRKTEFLEKVVGEPTVAAALDLTRLAPVEYDLLYHYYGSIASPVVMVKLKCRMLTYSQQAAGLRGTSARASDNG